MGFLITVLVNAAALWVAVTLLEGIDYAGEWYQWLILAAIFGVVNAIVKPILKLSRSRSRWSPSACSSWS